MQRSRCTRGAPSTNGHPVALLSVHDEGIGLESADLDRIFDRFVHAVGDPVRGHTELGPTGRTTSMRDQVVFRRVAVMWRRQGPTNRQHPGEDHMM